MKYDKATTKATLLMAKENEDQDYNRLKAFHNSCRRLKDGGMTDQEPINHDREILTPKFMFAERLLILIPAILSFKIQSELELTVIIALLIFHIIINVIYNKKMDTRQKILESMKE